MWIKNERESTVRLKFRLQSSESEEYADLRFSDNGTVQVAEHVGEEAIERYSTISKYTNYKNEDSNE